MSESISFKFKLELVFLLNSLIGTTFYKIHQDLLQVRIFNESIMITTFFIFVSNKIIFHHNSPMVCRQASIH